MAIQNDFEASTVLCKPLMAHLATVEEGAPRSSPLWFVFENDAIWLFGTREDSFIKRLIAEPRCALSIVDFDLEQGVLLHVGIRGNATVSDVDHSRLKEFVSKYLGADSEAWNKWFVQNVVNPIDRMVMVKAETVVAKDVSYFQADSKSPSGDC